MNNEVDELHISQQDKMKFYGITIIRYAQNREIGKPNNLNFWSNKTKGPKQDSQNWVMSSMPEGGEP